MLTADAFIICGRLGEQFEFITCEQGNESPVWYYSQWAPTAKIEFGSFTEWLNAQLEGALEALNDGYFLRYPQGTEP